MVPIGLVRANVEQCGQGVMACVIDQKMARL